MITKEDIEFIKDSFKYALMRMEDLPALQHWGSLETKSKRVQETKEMQIEILKKLEGLA